MTAPNALKALVGNWQGANRLWLYPGDPVRVSETTASVALVAQGKFLSFNYTWFEDKPQEGFLLIGRKSLTGILGRPMRKR